MYGTITITIALAMMIATTLWLIVHLADAQWCHTRTTFTTTPLTPHSRPRAGVRKTAHRRTSASTSSLAMASGAASLRQALRKEE